MPTRAVPATVPNPGDFDRWLFLTDVEQELNGFEWEWAEDTITKVFLLHQTNSQTHPMSCPSLVDGNPMRCKLCEIELGDGYVGLKAKETLARLTPEEDWFKCENCKASGYVPHIDITGTKMIVKKCPICHGRGKWKL
jgi:hypothetical protein